MSCGSSSPATSSLRPERRWMVGSGSRSDRALCEDARPPSICSVRSHLSNAQRPTSNLPAQYARLDARFFIWPTGENLSKAPATRCGINYGVASLPLTFISSTFFFRAVIVNRLIASLGRIQLIVGAARFPNFTITIFALLLSDF